MRPTISCEFRDHSTVVLEKVIIFDSQCKRNFFRNRQHVCESLIRKVMEFDPMLLRNHQGVATAERLDIQKRIALHQRLALGQNSTFLQSRRF
jgi:hypothetical protein